MQDGEEPAGKRGQPAQPGLPQGAAELLLARAQVDGLAGRRIHPVRVPPAAAVADGEEVPAGGPLHLGHGLLRTAEYGTGPGQRPVGGDVGEAHLGAVPRHPGVVPHQPGRAQPVGGQPGPGSEPAPVVGQFAHEGPVLGGRAVQRYGGQHPAYVGRRRAGELLEHAPDFAAPQHGVGPAQPAADRGDGGEGPRGAAAGRVGLVRVHPLVGEVDEHHQGPARGPFGARPGPAAVLGDAAADVPRGGQHRGLGAAVGGPAHQGAAAALGRPGLGPPHLGADGSEVLGPPVDRGGDRRVDGRGPAAVGPGRRRHHRLPLTGSAGRGRGRARRSAGRRRGPARPRRGRGTSSRSRAAVSAGRSRIR